MTVAVGQIVTYTPHGPGKSANPRAASTYPALVTSVIDQSTVNLVVFRDLDTPLVLERVKNSTAAHSWM